MLRHLPKLKYCGLTIVVSNPSRFDTSSLLETHSNGGAFFDRRCLVTAGINRYQCDIRLADDKSPWLPDTKCLLLLGDKAMKEYLPSGKDATLNELRGSPYVGPDGLCYMCSYLPQDCVDRQNYESRLNPALYDYVEQMAIEAESKSATKAKKRKSVTSRSNYGFWLSKDVAKLTTILFNDGKIPHQDEPNYIYYPSSSVAINVLASTKGKFLYFDMETTMDLQITVFSFAFSLDNVFIVPVITHTYELAYGLEQLSLIFRALAIAVRDNTIVAHNGATFDFFVLAYKYGIPLGKSSYDTMLAMARCYPEIEKSLGHCVSLFTYETYHKDEAAFSFGSKEQHRNLCDYCGKDVSTMLRIHHAISSYAKTVIGLSESISQCMDAIRPYLVCSLFGIVYRQDKVVEIMAENDRVMTQYLRIIELLIGAESWLLLKRKSKKAMPTSNSQCITYFHDMLGLPIVGRSKNTNKPQLNEKNLLRMRLKHENPLIDLTIAYRKIAKETGTLKFTPWSTI